MEKYVRLGVGGGGAGRKKRGSREDLERNLGRMMRVEGTRHHKRGVEL